MSNDISTMFTKEWNKKNGRRGWVGWKAKREKNITPDRYGEYVLNHRRGRKKNGRKYIHKF